MSANEIVKAAALGNLGAEIEKQRSEVLAADDAERIARMTATSARNRLSDLQKEFDRLLASFKQEPRVSGTHWSVR